MLKRIIWVLDKADSLLNLNFLESYLLNLIYNSFEWGQDSYTTVILFKYIVL